MPAYSGGSHSGQSLLVVKVEQYVKYFTEYRVYIYQNVQNKILKQNIILKLSFLVNYNVNHVETVEFITSPLYKVTSREHSEKAGAHLVFCIDGGRTINSVVVNKLSLNTDWRISCGQWHPLRRLASVLG